MNLRKRILPDVVAIVLFAVIPFVYFFPAVTEGRILSQHDSVAGVGSGKESGDYYERTGERTRWTNALFGGMPTYQMAPSYDSTDSLRIVEKGYRLFLPGDVALVFIMLLGFYILLRAFDFKVWLASLGAIIWAFSSYFFIIIAAGHIWKFVTLAYIPPTIAGMVLIYRGKYLWGSMVTALFVALQILSNHIQMSYYFLFVMFFMAVAFGVEAWRKKELPRFLKSTAVLVVAALVGVAVNLSNLYHTYQYTQETMRGKSELVKADAGNQTKSGLERDYITQWSYGIGETFSLLVPNVKGGASNRGDKPMLMSDNEKAMKKADPQYTPIYSQLTQYWGEQPGTSGPVYVGAFVMMLFILGLFIVKGPMKWALLAATLLSVLLSWGKNFMGFTDFFLDYVPMYDKFRAVSSILVIAEFTIPLLAMLALKEIVTRPQVLKENLKALYVSFGLTAGLALLFAVAPRLFFPSYLSSMELNALQGSNLGEHLAPILANLEEMRVAIFTADAWRSFFIVAVGTLFLWLHLKGKLKAHALIVLVALLCIIDMWQVNKRYLNDDMFVEKTVRENAFKPSATDQYIMQDKALDYRVLNLATNTFNENETSYWHKSVGGYHAAKLRRYQEMIEEHIAPEMQLMFKEVVDKQGDMTQINDSLFPVINMLNTRWVIFPGQNGATIPLQNPHAYGNAWFVDEVKFVNNANNEIEALHQINPRHVAVADRKFADVLQGSGVVTSNSLAAPNHVSVQDTSSEGEASSGASDAHSVSAPSDVSGASAAPDADTVKEDTLSAPAASSRSVKLLNYEPNKLTYEVESPEGGTVVFSEIYYPGWQAFVDGKEIPVGRVDYILRAVNVPAGKHTVLFTFDPVSLHTTETIAFCALALLGIGVLAGLYLSFRKRGKD